MWDVDLDDLIEAQEDSDAMYEHGIKTSWTVIDRIVKSKYALHHQPHSSRGST